MNAIRLLGLGYLPFIAKQFHISRFKHDKDITKFVLLSSNVQSLFIFVRANPLQNEQNLSARFRVICYMPVIV